MGWALLLSTLSTRVSETRPDPTQNNSLLVSLLKNILLFSHRFFPSSMAIISPAAPPLNRPFNHRSTLASASNNFLFFRNPTPIIVVRCQKHVSDGISSVKSTNHASTVSSSIDFLTLCHRLKVCFKKPYRLSSLPKSNSCIERELCQWLFSFHYLRVSFTFEIVHSYDVDGQHFFNK